jgi:hypothetical protein
MDTNRERIPIDDDESAEPTETMSGVGVPAGDATVDGLGFDGPEDDAPAPDGEQPADGPSGEDHGAEIA